MADPEAATRPQRGSESEVEPALVVAAAVPGRASVGLITPPKTPAKARIEIQGDENKNGGEGGSDTAGMQDQESAGTMSA